MLKEILENNSNNIKKQLLLISKLIYQDLIDEIYKQVRDEFSKKEIVSILNKGEDEKLGIDVNEIFSNLVDKYAQKLIKKIGNFDEQDIVDASRDAKKEVKDPIQKEILTELIDKIL